MRQVEPRQAAAGAAPALAVDGDQHGRTLEALDQARGDDADHARVPGVGPQQDRAAVRVAGLVVHHAHRFLAAPSRRACGAAGCPPRDSRAMVSASSSSRASSSRSPCSALPMRPAALMRGASTNATCPLVMRLPCNAATLDQRAQAEPRLLVQPVEPEAREHAVLAHQRHDVGDGAERDHVEVAARAVEPAAAAQQALDELERHAHAGQRLERVGAAGPQRVDDRDGVGQHRGRLVVVGDHGVDAERARVRDGLGRGDAAVHGDDQRAAAALGLVDGIDGQPVAVLDAVRDAVLDARAQLLERAVEQERRGDAVDVVVALDEDALAAPRRRPGCARRRLEVAHLARVVQVVERRIEEPPRRILARDAAVHQRVRHGQRRAEHAGQRRGRCRGVVRMQHPLRWGGDGRRRHGSVPERERWSSTTEPRDFTGLCACGASTVAAQRACR